MSQMPDAAPVAASSGTPIAIHTTPSGTLAVYTNEALRLYLETMRSDEKIFSTLPFLTDFKKFPRVTDLMITYLDEFLKTCDSKLRLAPSILVGVLSELLILTLLKACGDFLDDINAIANYRSKKETSRIDYAIALVNKTKEKIQEGRELLAEEKTCFSTFTQIVKHMFDSIRLNRNEYVHPEPTSVFTLPESSVLLVHTTAFNTYTKAILELTDAILKLIPP